MHRNSLSLLKRSFGSLFMRLTGKSPGTQLSAILPRSFAMKLPNGTQRLIAARVTTQAIDILAQQDLPADVNILKSGSQTQIDFSFKQLLEKLSGSALILFWLDHDFVIKPPLPRI